MRLRDLGGGEPNDDLTWTLFDDPSRPLRPSRALPSEPPTADGDGDPPDDPADDATDDHAAQQASSEAERPRSSPPEATA